ncbi:MAG TPA: DUF3349 domain-containing protein [Mycobacterium sp.]|jgi:hypothetical protein|nr:DUF3349 domain-containing protein [Mycobacterium sp.]
MSLRDRVSSVVAFLRAGYPIGVCAVGYVPLLALLPRRASDDEIAVVARSLMSGRRPVGTVDIGVEITRITHEMPLPDDIERVYRRLTAFGA